MMATAKKHRRDLGYVWREHDSRKVKADVWLEWEIKDTPKGPELSTSVIWQDPYDKRRGDIGGWERVDSGLVQELIDSGHVMTSRDDLRKLIETAPYHLNGMKAGCEHQRAEKWDERPIDPAKPTNAYGKHFAGQRQDSWNMLVWVPRSEHPEGLLSEPCPTCGYKYGTAWRYMPLPEWVIEFFKSLE